MGFNLLAFAGGAAKSLTEEIDKREEEAKLYALNSTKMMHERYTKTLDSNRQQLSSIEDDLSVIRSNFPGKFNESELYQIGISNAQRKQLVDAARDPNIDKSLLDPKQIVKIIEDNTPGTAIERIRQSYAIPSVIAAKAAEAKESGFFSGFGERAGAAAAQKYAGMTGVSLEQMRGAQDWKAPTSTAEFDLTSLVKVKTLPEQLADASSAVAKYAKLGDTVALQKSKDLYKSLTIEKNELDKMLSGDDAYAQELLNKGAKARLVSSDPNKYTKEDQDDAKRFLDFERKQAQLLAAAVRAPQGDGTSTSKAASLLDAAIKNATDGFLVKRGDRQIILGTNINAASSEGVAKVREVEEKSAIQLLKVMGGINQDNSIKDNATARIVLSRGLRTYEDGGKLFIGTPAAASTATGKTAQDALPIPSASKDVKVGTYYSTDKGVVLWDGKDFITPNEVAVRPIEPVSQTPKKQGFSFGPLNIPEPKAKGALENVKPTDTSTSSRNLYLEQKAENEKARTQRQSEAEKAKLQRDIDEEAKRKRESQQLQQSVQGLGSTNFKGLGSPR